jgi:hypothetical protein
VVSVTRDRGFLYGGSDLSTTVQFGINLVTVVVNNGSYAPLWGTDRQREGRHRSSRLLPRASESVTILFVGFCGKRHMSGNLSVRIPATRRDAMPKLTVALALFGTICSSAFTTDAYARGDTGHKIVCDIAFKTVKPASKAAIIELVNAPAFGSKGD